MFKRLVLVVPFALLLSGCGIYIDLDRIVTMGLANPEDAYGSQSVSPTPPSAEAAHFAEGEETSDPERNGRVK